MTGGREPRATEDSTRDEYPPDTGFGRAPTADQEVVDALAEEGEGESPLREGSRPVPPPGRQGRGGRRRGRGAGRGLAAVLPGERPALLDRLDSLSPIGRPGGSPEAHH